MILKSIMFVLTSAVPGHINIADLYMYAANIFNFTVVQ